MSFLRYSSDVSNPVSPVPPNIPTTILEVDTTNETNSHRKSNTQRNVRALDANIYRTASNSRYLHENYAKNPALNSIDVKLSDWLSRHNIDAVSRNIILAEQFSYENFIYDMEKSDLHRMGLR